MLEEVGGAGGLRRPTHRRLLSGLAAMLATVTLASCSGSSGKGADGPGGSGGGGIDYLALGDSAPFGYRIDPPQGYDASAFVGYPQLIAEDRHLNLYDASCPGETSASFLDMDAVSNGCTNGGPDPEPYREVHPLHAKYSGAQLDQAVTVLQDNPDVQVVTLQLGGNDLALCLASLACLTPGGAGAMTAQLEDNVSSALATLRGEGEYDGTIVVVNYYAVNYGDPILVALTQGLNAALADAAAAHGAVVADAFEGFRETSAEEAGDTIEAGLVWPDDSHPSTLGQQLLARIVGRLI